MILNSKEGCSRFTRNEEDRESCGKWPSGSCALYEEAREKVSEDGATETWDREESEEFNEEADGYCDTFTKCCAHTCVPSDLTYSECC